MAGVINAVADYVLEPGMGVVRLDAGEFAKAVQTKSLGPRIDDLRQAFAGTVLVIEGEFVAVDAHREAVLSMIELGVVVLQTRNAVDTARYLELMAAAVSAST